MNWLRFRNLLVNQHSDLPQNIKRVEYAVGMLEEGLRLLAGMGHLFHLAEGQGSGTPDFPRLMYHLEAAPRGHLVLCEEDRTLLGEGWFDTLADAKHADGMGEQFKRGGIFPKKGLPAIIPESVEMTRLDKERRDGFG